MAAEDEELSGLNVGFQEPRILDEPPCPPAPALEISLHLLEQRLECLEIQALLPAGDFLGFPLFGAGPNMAQLGDVGRTGRALQLGEQFVFTHGVCRRHSQK